MYKLPVFLFIRFTAIFLIGVALIIQTPLTASAIVGGEQAPTGAQSWMVGLLQANMENSYYAQFCGGTLIDASWVLTAAHCTYNEEGFPFAATDIEVVINRTRLSSTEGERLTVSQIIRHPQFDSTLEADIALLQLATPAQSQPIRIAQQNHTANQPTTVFGWGLTESGQAADHLRQTSLNLIEHGACAAIYEDYGYTITNKMLCAGLAQGGYDACIGDSGGPLVIYDKQHEEQVQIGIISFGKDCGKAGLYGVYTDVTKFNSWIAFQLIVH